MSTSLLEVLGTRRRKAAENAVDAAKMLDETGSRSLTDQLALEDALSDLQHYAELHTSLESLGDLGDFRRDGGYSLVGDLWASRQGDKAAAGRLNTHARATNAGSLHEQRAIGGGSLWATAPKWMVTDAAPTAIPKAPILHLVSQPLDPGVQGTIGLVRWSSAPTASAQPGLNGALPEPSIVDGTAGPAVKTYGTRVKMSVQLFEQGRAGIDAQLIPAMISAVDAAIEGDLISADGTAGTVLGITHTSGVGTQSYTDSTPTLGESWPIFESAIRSVEIGFGGAPYIAMHPRRLSWLRQRAVVEANPALDIDAPTVPGTTACMLGTVHVIADPTIPTNLGTGTNEDLAIVFRSTDVFDLFVGEPRVQLGDVDDDMMVYVNVFKQVVFTAARLPGAISVVSGSGCAAPTP